MSTETTTYYRVMPAKPEQKHHVKEVFDNKQEAMTRAEELSLEHECTVELLEVIGVCESSLTVAGKVVAALVEAGHTELACEFVESYISDNE